VTDLAEEFVLLATGDKPSGTALRSRPVAWSEGEPLALIADDAHGQRHLLVRIDDQKLVGDRSSKGVALTARTLVTDGQERSFADLHCLVPSLHLVFERLGEDVLRRIEAAKPCESAAVCRATLADWRELLRSAQRPMSRDEVVGLTGELVVLEALTEKQSWKLQGWRGPDALTHDFALGGCEIEVKTTASVDANQIHVSNIDQLDPTDIPLLHLAMVHLREDSAGETLDQRIGRLIARGLPRDVLLDRLDKAGYVYESGADEDLRMAVRTIRIWEGSDDFPGLRRAALGNRLQGVSGITYELMLDACPAPLKPAQVESLLETWGGV